MPKAKPDKFMVNTPYLFLLNALQLLDKQVLDI